MATVKLGELSDHLSAAKKIIDEAIASDEEEPSISFGELRKSLRGALDLLGPGAQDSALARDAAPKPTRISDGNHVRYQPVAGHLVADVFNMNANSYRNPTE
jgi:hypothetical protein